MVTSAAERRHRFLALAWRRRRPARLASSAALLASRTARLKWPDLGDVLRGIPWAVCGGVATRLYMPERATVDLDVLIDEGDSATVGDRLEAARFRREGELGIPGSIWRSPDGVEINTIERGDPWVASALDRAAHNRDAQGLPILPLPYLVLMKLEASRGQDLADLLRMLGAAPEEQLQQVRQVVSQYAPGDLQDLESLIQLGRLELG